GDPINLSDPTGQCPWCLLYYVATYAALYAEEIALATTVAAEIAANVPNPVSSPAAAAVHEAQAGFCAANGSVKLFRAVEPGELADIATRGLFRNPLGIESKYFASTAEEATQEAQMLSRLTGAGPYTIVETSLPSSVFRMLPPGNVLQVD